MTTATLLVFSNVGDWDDDSIGFIKHVDIEGDAITHADLIKIAKDVVEGEDDHNDPEVLNASVDDIPEMLNDLEYNTYCNDSFDWLVAFRSSSNRRPNVVGFIMV